MEKKRAKMDFDNITLEEIVANPESLGKMFEHHEYLNSTDFFGDENHFNNNGTIGYYSNYTDEKMAVTVQIICANLGAISVVLNVFVIIALLRYRHRVLSNVFYVIVLHCAVLDVVRGCCLIVYGLPHFALSFFQTSIAVYVSLIRAKFLALFFLKICNLLTIFNLLVFTTNEFIVIRYPLHYRRYFRRKAVFVILASCWMLSVVMGLGLIPSSNTSPSTRDDSIDWATLSLLMISLLCFLVLAIVVVCYAFILRTIRRFKEEGCLNNDENHRVHNRSIHRPIRNQNSNSSSNGSRWRSVQAMSRHKYIYVIGSVLMVDLLFLFPYSGIQLVSFLHINHFIEVTHHSQLLRSWLQVLIGIHSVCQPLCYFRMTEFRRLACCDPRRHWNRTKSFSQINKSFANTRSQMKDDDNNCVVYASEPLLHNGETTPARSERSVQHAWTRGESVRFRTYGSEHVDRDIELVSICGNTIAPQV